MPVVGFTKDEAYVDVLYGLAIEPDKVGETEDK